MASITQDSFLETRKHQKVIFQKGRDVLDSELNELQDVIRVFASRLAMRMCRDGVDTGFRVEANGNANELDVTLGDLVTDGYYVTLAADATITGLTTPSSGSRTDKVYVRLRELEVADPQPLAELGELSRRKQLEVTLVVAEGTTHTSTGNVWEGGTWYLEIASVVRIAAQPIILTGDITVNFRILPGAAVDQVTTNLDGRAYSLVAGWGGRVECVTPVLLLDVNTDGAYAGTNAVQMRFGRDTVSSHSHTVRANSEVDFTAPPATSTPVGILDSAMTERLYLSDYAIAAGNRLAGQRLRTPWNTTATSVIRSLNGRAYATAGNGTDTYGDYNGATAISDIIAAAIAASVTSLTIRVKAGSYTLASKQTVTFPLHIIGEDRAAVTITSTEATAETVVISGTRVTLTRLNLLHSGNCTTWVSSSGLEVDDCQVSLCVHLKDAPTHVHRITGSTLGTVASVPVIDIASQTTNPRSTALLVEGCTLIAVSGAPVIRCTTNPIVNITVRASRFTLPQNTGASTESGIIGATAFPTVLKSAVFEDCQFYGYAGSCYAMMALVKIPSLTFDRCFFSMSGSNTTGAFFDTLADVITVRGCTFELNAHLCAAVSTEGAMVAIKADQRVHIENTTLSHTRTEAFSGTVVSTGRLALMSVLSSKEIQIKGIQFDLPTTTVGTGTTPRQVLYVGADGSTNPHAVVDDVVLLVNVAASNLITQAFMRIVGQFRLCTVSRAKIQPNGSSQIPTGTAAILLGGDVGLSDTITAGDGIRVRDCMIHTVQGTGIWDDHNSSGENVIDGCEVTSTAAGGADFPIKLGESGVNTGDGGISVINCRIETSPVVGIRSYRNKVTIRGNSLTGTTSGGTSGNRYQIFISAYTGGAMTSCISWVCRDNVCLSSAGVMAEIGLDTDTAAIDRFRQQGFDTAYDASAVQHFEVGRFDTDQPMIFNAARLELF